MKKLFLLLLALILLLTAACQKPHPSNEPDTTSPEGTLDSDPDNPGNLSDSIPPSGGNGFLAPLYFYDAHEYEDYLEFLASEVSPEWLVSYDMISDFGSFGHFQTYKKNFQDYVYHIEPADGDSISIHFVRKGTESYDRLDKFVRRHRRNVENAQDMRLHSKDGYVEHEGIYYCYIMEGILCSISWETDEWLIYVSRSFAHVLKIDESPLGKLLSLETAPEAVAQINAAIAPALAKTPAAE